MRVHVRREEDAVDDGREADWRVFVRRVEHVLGRLRAKGRERVGAGRRGELRAVLLGRPASAGARSVPPPAEKNAPLSPMALWKSPFASGEAMSALTANDPADSPKIVTFAGSPPNAAMLSLTHRSAATWSSRP